MDPLQNSSTFIWFLLLTLRTEGDNHLHCVVRIIIIFHASGHTLYAKSSHVYLQDMLQLSQKLSQEQNSKFVTEWYFTIRRTLCQFTGFVNRLRFLLVWISPQVSLAFISRIFVLEIRIFVTVTLYTCPWWFETRPWVQRLRLLFYAKVYYNYY